MFDAILRRHIDPPLDRFGQGLARLGATANAVTALGLVLGLGAACLISQGWTGAGLAALLLSRLADGLDGAVARATRPTDLGGYFDICADFFFYGAVPLGFVWLDPQANGIAGAVLLLSFYVNGASFLGFAILAEKHKLETRAQGIKTLYYSGGLLEGAETIGFFVALCLWPAGFVALAWTFAALCFATAALRVRHARRCFRNAAQN